MLLVLTGELDLVATVELDRRLAGAESLKPALIVLDLRGLTFMDSSGFVALLRADLRRRESGGDLMIVRGGVEITRIFEISDPGRRLPLVDGVPSARWIAA
ncbi:MAG: anti-sigma factor antagonist [Solirubrobacteraceae bacterium]|nr:anti-sigma factor antagonist [Solirubrobacteraceae bacterium]